MSDLRMAIARNIRTARRRLGLSQDDLAHAIGAKSGETISQIEKGEREVKAWELNRIAKRLHVDFYDLMSEQEAQSAPQPLWRKEPAANKPEVESWLLLRSKYYRHVMNLLHICPAEPLASKQQIEPLNASFETISNLGEHVARILDLSERPARRLFDALEARCVMVFCADLGSDGSALSVWGHQGPAMVLNSSEPPWRRSFSCAHELFHLVTWDNVEPLRSRLGARQMQSLETRANTFASALLMPSGYLLPELRGRVTDGQLIAADVISLAKDFGVSTAALLWRLRNLGIISQEIPESLLSNPRFHQEDQVSRVGTWDTPHSLPRRFVELSFAAYARALLSRARLAEMLETDLTGLPALLAYYGIELEPELAYKTQIPDPGRQCDHRVAQIGPMVSPV